MAHSKQWGPFSAPDRKLESSERSKKMSDDKINMAVPMNQKQPTEAKISEEIAADDHISKLKE